MRYFFILAMLLALSCPGYSQQWPTVAGKLQVLTDSLNFPVGQQSGVVVTLDPDLNRVFRNNIVYNMYQTYPSSRFQHMLKIFTVECNCNERLLKDTLENAPYFGWVSLVNQAILLSSEKEIDQNGLKIFPVPFESSLYFEFNNNIEIAEIFDLAGKLVYKQNRPTGKLVLTNLKSGSYLLLLTSGSEKYRQIVMKK